MAIDIDVVDIGGASRVGVPTIPPIRDGDGSNDDEGERLTAPVPADAGVPLEVQKAVAPGASVAYPNEHPANSGRLKQSADGAMIVPKGTHLTQSLLTQPRQITPAQVDARKASERELDKLLEDEKRVKTAQEETVAKSPAGFPVIEVIFHTEIGAIVGYFTKVIKQGSWLILITDNRAPAQAKFIPQPKKNGEPIYFDMVITGPDRQSERVRATPLRIQFTVDHQDFIVMMLEDKEDNPEESSGD